MRYELDRRYAADNVEIIELPRPHDPRELFDFSGAHHLIEAAYELCAPALDAYLSGQVISTLQDGRDDRKMRVRFHRARSQQMPANPASMGPRSQP